MERSEKVMLNGASPGGLLFRNTGQNSLFLFILKTKNKNIQNNQKKYCVRLIEKGVEL